MNWLTTIEYLEWHGRTWINIQSYNGQIYQY